MVHSCVQGKCPCTGFSFSNRVGVEKIETGGELTTKILEKPKDCYVVEIKVAGEGHVHRWRKSPVACRKGKPCMYMSYDHCHFSEPQ